MYRTYYKEAAAVYQNVLIYSPYDEQAFEGLDYAFMALKRYDKAINAFRQALQCAATSMSYAGLGEAYANRKRYHEAAAAYEKAIALDPSDHTKAYSLHTTTSCTGKKRRNEMYSRRYRSISSCYND